MRGNDVYYIGIDIGGTKCAVVKGNLEEGVTEKIRFETTTCEETLEKIFDATCRNQLRRSVE